MVAASVGLAVPAHDIKDHLDGLASLQPGLENPTGPEVLAARRGNAFPYARDPHSILPYRRN